MLLRLKKIQNKQPDEKTEQATSVSKIQGNQKQKKQLDTQILYLSLTNRTSKWKTLTTEQVDEQRITNNYRTNLHFTMINESFSKYKQEIRLNKKTMYKLTY